MGHSRPIHIHHTRIRPILHPSIVICINDWQPLWNGYYVRRYVDRIWIVNAAGDRILQGDEVILLPNGYYKVRNGDFWRVYDERGESIFNIWGEDVQLLDDGIFQCYRAGMYFYYDELGNRLD